MRFTTRHQADEEAAAPGIGESAKRIMAAAGRYAEARGRLFSLEASLALRSSKTGIFLIGGAVLGVLIGVLALAAAAVLGLGHLLQNHALACVITGALFLIISVLLIRRGFRALSTTNLFPVTRDEIHRDIQWLTQSPPTPSGSGARL